MPLNDQDRARVAEINANYYAYDNGNLMRSVRRLLSIIDRLSEQPEVVRAEWIHGQRDNGKTYCYCSECSEDALYDSSGYRAFSDRCPHCGAQMNGKEVKHG